MRKALSDILLTACCFAVAVLFTLLHVSMLPIIVTLGVITLVLLCLNLALQRHNKRLRKQNAVLKRYILNR